VIHPPLDPQHEEWRKVALRVTKGGFDIKTKRTRKPPEGSLRKSLIIGLRSQWRVPEVRLALKHLGVLDVYDLSAFDLE